VRDYRARQHGDRGGPSLERQVAPRRVGGAAARIKDIEPELDLTAKDLGGVPLQRVRTRTRDPPDHVPGVVVEGGHVDVVDWETRCRLRSQGDTLAEDRSGCGRG